MVAETGMADWYDSVSLTSYGDTQVEEAKQRISRQRKPVTQGRVIAELHFGFWTSMFESHFEKPTARFLPRGIRATFPHMPKSKHKRKSIKADLDKIRKLRNRIFHHERISHWTDLPQLHQLILDFLGWLSPDLAEVVQMVDTFPSVYGQGIQPYLDKLDRHIDGASEPPSPHPE